MTDPTQALLRSLFSSNPDFIINGRRTTIVNIDIIVPGKTMVLDLNDGTTIRLDFERYVR